MRWTLIDTNGTRALKDDYDYLKCLSRTRVCVRIDGKWGLLNGDTGEWYFRPKFDELREYSGSTTSAVVGDDHLLVDINGGELGFRAERIGVFSEGLATARNGSRWGYINELGVWAIEPKYQYASRFSGGRAVVGSLPGGLGYIDKANTAITEFEFETARLFADGLAFAVVRDGPRGFIRRDGNFIRCDWVETARPFREGFSRYSPASTEVPSVGFLNTDLKPAFDRQFDDAVGFRNGLASVKQEDKWGAIDHNGYISIETVYDAIGHCRLGLIPAERNKRYGFVNRSGEVAIPFSFGTANSFTSDGVAAVEIV